MPPGNPNSFRPAVTLLEGREVPAVVSAQVVNGVLIVQGDDAGSNFLITQTPSAVTVQEVVSNDTRSYARSAVRIVVVNGGAGNDSFTTVGNDGVGVRVNGGAGNDTMTGGAGRDVMFGGAGRDRLSGGGGRDLIYGSAGNDFILGGDGDDLLFGGKGNDTVNGGLGADAVAGGVGDDTLIAIDDGTTDTLDSGAGGVDFLWFDLNGAEQDGVTGITPDDLLRPVASFANGADKTLDGDEIADPGLIPLPPTIIPDEYEKFVTRPLFASGGPTLNDIDQQFASFVPPPPGPNPRVDDSWLLSSFAAMLDTFPNLIRSNIADFGDGTYGVRLNGTFLRIDNDLPVNFFGEVLTAYAGVGAENSLWVALLEKAFATITSPTDPSYSLLNRNANPSLDPSDAFQSFGATTATVTLPGTFVSSVQLANFVATQVRANIATVLTVTTAPGGTQLRNGQSYAVTGFGVDALGAVSSFTLQDPRGGSFTITPANLFATTGRLDLGDFSAV